MKVILIRGLAREASHWGTFPTNLKDQLKNYEIENGETLSIVSLDMLGCGEKYKEKAASSIEQYGDDLASILFHGEEQQEKNSEKKIILIGISLGGMVAMDLLQRYTGFLDGIVLINSSVGDLPLHWRLRLRAWLPALASILMPMPIRERIMLRVVSNDRSNIAMHEKRWLEIQEKHPVTRRTILLQLFAAVKFRLHENVRKKSERVPGVVLSSRKDNMVSFRCSESIADRLGWPLHLHSTAGHDLPLDDERWVTAHVEEFIKNV